jgi:hypothetical protein
MWSKRKLLTLLMGIQVVTAITENIIGVPQTIKT